MGNGATKLSTCFTGSGDRFRQKHISVPPPTDPLDEGLGHSFCYVEETTMFRTISGASVSANAATPLSTSLYDPYGHIDRAAAFESTTSFPSIPLQPIPKSSGGGGGGGGPVVLGSGPIERGFLSGPIERGSDHHHRLQRSFSHGLALRVGSRKRSLVRILRRAISRTVSRGQNSIVAPVKSRGTLDDDVSLESQNLQWAQGKAGEDRVHVVVSEEHGWLFVGIYDGFNGPDATDYLLSHLYPTLHRELKGLLWDDPKPQDLDRSCLDESCSDRVDNDQCEGRWRCEWEREKKDLDRRLKEQINNRKSRSDSDQLTNHSDVLKALSLALRKTEEAYLDTADKMLEENPELALMGSCVLVMLMKGEDIYVMNVGDSRVVLGQKSEQEYWLAKIRQDLKRINEETMKNDLRVSNERVKGSLKVTRAFGAGFLKQPKWNNALLEMFQIDYIGESPYINCLPSLYHHRLGSKDKFLILSSDGLYQYFTNEEAVSEVELFITLQPEGDPAQHLVQELLFRAAKKAGMVMKILLHCVLCSKLCFS
ncbi:hypothetical protein Bca52824_062153 [Brassica carinata]|uniref:PPM-type phosphatase domain-containing protein n=1 Tax=Brassica carinata TaxID=52824 RepID=A0A8X7QDQ7_BRACI|nr:hypothetical protein Bca52824_062153 [Brassica carinata]